MSTTHPVEFVKSYSRMPSTFRDETEVVFIVKTERKPCLIKQITANPNKVVLECDTTLLFSR